MFKRSMAALAMVVGLAGPASADTIGYADAITLLANSCGSDIGKYCPKANLGNWEIGRCLMQNRANLSGQCAADLVRVGQSIEARKAAQASAEQICATDIRRRCPMTEAGRGRVLQCLLKAERTVSAACNAAITNAGWR
ncbi:hypothetical protein [Acuticoccus yangtzensis]|uniref:hypothetical protein n=1 Tax=Acuticoccus yangtzensis TaxID=1443441 RepID=UPI00094976EB|nr:hypothetical protein [Acuticoccus yangtzensis]